MQIDKSNPDPDRCAQLKLIH